MGRRCAESDRHFYRRPFHFSILKESMFLAITLQPSHSSVPAHPNKHPPHRLIYNFFRSSCSFSWTWWELGAFNGSPIENTGHSEIQNQNYMKRKQQRFSTPECFCFQTPEYILYKGKRESIRYVNINIYEINNEVSTLFGCGFLEFYSMEDNVFVLTGKMVEKSGQAETCLAFQLTGKRPWNLSSNIL